MSAGSFDPAALVAFDLHRGVVSVEGAPAHALVPAHALAALFRSAPEPAQRAFATSIGASLGARAAERLGGQASLYASSPEDVLAQIAGEVALMGFGALGLERWGDALVVVVDGAPVDGVDALLEDVIGPAFTAATGLSVVAAPLGRQGDRVRFLLASAAAAAHLRERAPASNWIEAIAALHEPDRGAT